MGNFFFNIDFDDDGRLKNVVWVHPQGRLAYEEFHDVICFDTTYIMNRYKMPIAFFVLIITVNLFSLGVLFF